MEDIRKLVWGASLNVQININSRLLITDIDPADITLNLRIPRNTYIVNYLKVILDELQGYMNVNIDTNEGGMFWFEYEGVQLYWNYPLGTLYDTLTGLHPSKRAGQLLNNSRTINVWKLQLNYNKNFPMGMIPIIDGMVQVEKYWMHQWKQVCFILNGSSKKIMSLSMKDSREFWKSIYLRNQERFESLSSKIIPVTPRHIPIIIHTTFPDITTIHPVADFKNDITNKEVTLHELMISEIPQLFANQGGQVAQVVCNGIEVPLEMTLLALYQRLMSFDGFLHISVCLISKQ